MPEAQRAMPEGEQGGDVTLTRLREIRDGLDENLTEREAIDELDFIINDAPSGYFPQDILNKVDQAKRDLEEEFTTWAGRGDSEASTESAISSVMSFLDSKESGGEAAPTRFMPEGATEPWRMTKKEFFHPQISRKFIQAESAKDGTIIGTIGDVVHGEKTRAILSPVLDVPIMIIRTPVQEGKKIVAGDKYDFDGASGTFQGKPTIFINPNKRMVGTLWEEAAHQMRRAKGRNIRKADIRKIIDDDRAFENEYKNDPEEISAKKLSNYLGSLASKEKSHREIVMNAVEAGLPVPKNVLSEYGVTENQTGQMRFMPEKLDSDYMKAVESGDVEAQQRMVDEAAKRAGYNVGPVWHGTNSESFSTFDPSRGKVQAAGKGFYFSNSESVASRYGENKIKAYLKLKDPVVNDENGVLIGDRETSSGDGRWIKGGFPGLKKGEQIFLVRNPEQIKSADPITRDDSGNVIPLSKRFDVGSRDMRFMPEGEFTTPNDRVQKGYDYGYLDGLSRDPNTNAVQFTRPIGKKEALPLISERPKIINEADIESFQFTDTANVSLYLNNGKKVRFKFDPTLLEKPETKDFAKEHAGKRIQLAMADRHTATGGDMGGVLYPWLKSNQVTIIGDDGIEYKAVWANNAWKPVLSMRKKAFDQGIFDLAVYIMGPDAHGSNLRTVRTVSNEVDHANISPDYKDVLLYAANYGVKRFNTSHYTAEIAKKNKILSEVKSDIQKSKDQNEIDKLKKQEVKISKEIDAADKKLQSYKLSEEEIKLAAILKNYKSATTRLKNNTGTEKGVKTHKSALDKFIKSPAFKKIKKEIHNKQMINLGNSFDERKAAVNATYGIDANGFDTESVMQELADFDGADINQIVASVELSKNPELFAVYLGDDPKQAKFMTAQEAEAAQQLKADPNFVAHESYEWVMLGPKNGNNFLNSNPKKAVEYFPDFARQYKEKTGKLQGVPQETSIMGAMRDSGAVILELPKQEQ